MKKSAMDLSIPLLREAAAALAQVAMTDALLPGVEVNIYQGLSGTWHADVLLDPYMYTEEKGNVPLERDRLPRQSSGDGRWWYSQSSGARTYVAKDSGINQFRNEKQAIALLDEWVADTLTAVATLNLRKTLVLAVKEMDRRKHGNAHLNDYLEG
jgi:hypothetical protein